MGPRAGAVRTGKTKAEAAFGFNFKRNWLLLVCVFSCLSPSLAEESYAGCSSTETQGMHACEYAGDSFFYDQNKAARCPSSTKAIENWSCNDWKCHMYCANPDRGEARKSCTTCDEVKITGGCFSSQKSLCESMTASLDCDVNCNGA
eukprot:CAMPEP_0206497700 /NCGR_PEP_ID=MMETSP0324_2-20121206/50417_1 /ASSEMBLY_ACC=CAM_ASM_000836 /TAXON_ID=2866 /ORGANISM="Crypthecodinium cohnii, Strain Seligo" /LENGTH=146 /DNA_ID=CAMNT_0053983471 /DNA_START=83 /DNA_END=520 /DNA_ORIENTATION=-